MSKTVSKILRCLKLTSSHKRVNVESLKGTLRVSNMVGSSSDKGSMRKYWMRHTGDKFSKCQIKKCKNPATVGGHVWVKGLFYTRGPYILPICQVITEIMII